MIRHSFIEAVRYYESREECRQCRHHLNTNLGLKICGIHAEDTHEIRFVKVNGVKTCIDHEKKLYLD